MLLVKARLEEEEFRAQEDAIERAKHEFELVEEKYLFEEQHFLLQKELLKDSKAFSEKHLQDLDSRVKDSMDGLIKKLGKLDRFNLERSNLKRQIKCNFMQRITEKPFGVTVEQGWPKFCYNEEVMLKIKKEIRHLKHILRLLHLHPCYLQNLFIATSPDSLGKGKTFE